MLRQAENEDQCPHCKCTMEKIHESYTIPRTKVTLQVHTYKCAPCEFTCLPHSQEARIEERSRVEYSKIADNMNALLKELIKIHGAECSHLDHHGYCQTHFVEEDCVIKRAVAAVYTLDGDKNEKAN